MSLHRPLFISAVKDAQDYLVAEELNVGEVFDHDDHVYVLLKQQAEVCMKEQPLAQSVAQWKTFTRHLVEHMYHSSDQEICSNEGVEILSVVSLLRTLNCREASLKLLLGLLRNQLTAGGEGVLGPSEEFAITWLVCLAEYETDPAMQLLCAKLLQSIVCGTGWRRVPNVERFRPALLRLSKSPHAEVKKVAVAAVRYLSGSSCGDREAVGRRRDLDTAGCNKGVRSFDTAEDALEMLLSKESIQLKEFALEYFAELTSAYDWHSFLEAHEEDFFLAVFAVGRRDAALAKMVAQILQTLTFDPRIYASLFRYDSLHFLDTQLFYEEEESVRSYFITVLRNLLSGPVSPPTQSLMSILTSTRNSTTKLLASEALIQVAKSDSGDNELGRCLGEIIMEAFEALNAREIELTSHLIQILATVSINANNQEEVQRLNGASLLVEALEFGQRAPPNADVQMITRMQRAAAKTLANLSSSSSTSRSTTHESRELFTRATMRLGDVSAFEDAVVRMYLQMCTDDTH